MTPFFIPFIFGRSGGSRRIAHVTPTPKPQEATPEVDLEAEIDKYFEGFGCDGPDGKYAYLKIDTIKDMIRHFCGLNPKHELPGVISGALADLCDKVEKYTRQETSRSILMNSLHAAQKLLAVDFIFHKYSQEEE